MVIYVDCNHHAASFTRECAAEDEEYPLAEMPLGIEAGEYAFVYRYPLSQRASFRHALPNTTSVVDILLQARADYEHIYAEEDRTVGPTENIPGMLNRQQSQGPYGIWGHDFSDLYFEGVEIDTAERIVTFNMGS